MDFTTCQVLTAREYHLISLNVIYSTTGGDDTSFYQYTDVATAANIYGANKKGFSALPIYI